MTTLQQLGAALLVAVAALTLAALIESGPRNFIRCMTGTTDHENKED